MNVNVGDVVKIMSFKHNGYIHRVWDSAIIIDVTDERLVVCTKKSRVTESNERVWYTKEPAILYFYFNKWFNTIAMLRNDGVYYYTNISSPCIVENKTIKYVDYDIDVKSKLDKSYRIMDLGEYYAHRYSMNYPDNLNDIIFKTLDETIRLFESKQEPYVADDALSFYSKVENTFK